ncbi:hypothetical protein AAUPMB_05058, partial [Pasteurella multocida subsp. multocida str. Anand1_buffalo]
MHQQTKMHLQQLQLNMQSLGLWQMTPP